LRAELGAVYGHGPGIDGGVSGEAWLGRWIGVGCLVEHYAQYDFPFGGGDQEGTLGAFMLAARTAPRGDYWSFRAGLGIGKAESQGGSSISLGWGPPPPRPPPTDLGGPLVLGAIAHFWHMGAVEVGPVATLASIPSTHTTIFSLDVAFGFAAP
jgi:hypothetical protein